MLLKSEGCGIPSLYKDGFRHRRGGSGRTRITVQCLGGGGSGELDSEGGMGGDVRVQQALVEMLQMQVSKVKMSEFVDERSQYMKSIAEDYHSDHARIARRAMKGLDAAGSRVLRELDAGAGAIEKELRLARADMEAQSKEVAQYQTWSAHVRNEGLFFKTLYSSPETTTKTPVQKDLIVSSSSGDFSTGYKQFLSGSIALVLTSLVYSSGSAFVTGTFMRPWKLASYGIILTLLLTQLAYVDVLVGEDRREKVQMNLRDDDVTKNEL